MKRRTKQRMTAIHVSIPVRLLEDFDDTLRFNQSRSAKISYLISQEISGDNSLVISQASTRQLMAALHSRDDVDDLLKALLLQILTKSL
jgi:metal-responsive CopG/Arc/MetJ family transcriptional regulator